MLRLRVFFAALLILGAFATTPATAEKRVALVIGNDRYPNLRPDKQLLKAVNDAQAVGDALKKVGFTVIRGANLGRQGMIDKLAELTAQLEPGDIAAFFYAGHGVAIGGVNYLVPTDVPAVTGDAELRVKGASIAETDVVDELQAKSVRVALLVLDACRDNPFPRNGTRSIGNTRGLTDAKRAEGVFTIYAAGIGQTALDELGPNDPNRNSVFTRIFVEELPKPGIDLAELAVDVREQVAVLARQAKDDSGRSQPHAQTPAYYDQTLGRFYFNPGPRQSKKPDGELPVEPGDPSDACDGTTFAGPPSLVACPLSPARERALKPKDAFKECAACPEMVVVPAGSFMMGSPADEAQRNQMEGPQHRVTFANPFAVGRFAVTFEEWDACVKDGGCSHQPKDEKNWGRGRRPVINVSVDDAKGYVAWLSRKTGRDYRLLSEAEREYVTRAGTTTPFWTGATISTTQANYNGNFIYGGGTRGDNRVMTMPVDSFAPNPWGLYQVSGNVYEWIADCWHPNYNGAPTDGSVWDGGDCTYHMIRGGSWFVTPRELRAASRLAYSSWARVASVGFRVARTLAR